MHIHHTQFVWIGPVSADVTTGFKDVNRYLQIPSYQQEKSDKSSVHLPCAKYEGKDKPYYTTLQVSFHLIFFYKE